MSAVGINLSSSKISVIELAGSRKDIIIKNMVKAELPSNSIIKGEVQNPIILANGLKEIWKKYKISDRKVMILKKKLNSWMIRLGTHLNHFT
ncbi:MAG: pilus assembly protein PilM [Candidatus Hydromicrobium sp.]|nr:pilus assembly protein PilM [Candidatus Hydromicrobium sp.]